MNGDWKHWKRRLEQEKDSREGSLSCWLFPIPASTPSICYPFPYSQLMAFYPSPKLQLHAQEAAHRHPLDDSERFWAHEAAQIQWHKLPSAILQESEKALKSGILHPTWSWFPDGEFSTCFNCVDRHVQAGRGESLALIWDSPVTGSKLQFTYNQMLHEVETLAGVLREQGVGKGDVVLIYMPMIPAAVFCFRNSRRISPGCSSCHCFWGLLGPRTCPKN